LRIGGLNVGYKALLGVLYELDEGFGTVVVVFGQTLVLGIQTCLKIGLVFRLVK